ncbi:MAG: hypothetical protein IH624_18990 [Phycisphaerae bacterium]|nr:hypothetical protein [Phycisphaerae bacterium]
MFRFLLVFAVAAIVSPCLADNAPSVQTECPAPFAEVAAQASNKPVDQLTLDEILAMLRRRTSEIRSYKANIKYLFIQDPELLDSRTVRKGVIYYQKTDGRSHLRVNFDTIQQDDTPLRQRMEQFVFDGISLTKIDYELKTVDVYQQAEQDNPQDVFEYISHNFPIVGFSPTETLRKQFDISIIEQPADRTKPVRLHLKVKPDSMYKDDYRDIDFSIDSRTWLPLRVVAQSKEEDVYDIHFLDAAVNKKFENRVFVVETPKSFSKNIHPLQKDREGEK